MKIAILGYGEQGRSAYAYWDSPDNQITICDQDESLHLPDGVSTQLGKDYLHELSAFDLIVRSPSIYPNDIIKANSAEIIHKVTTVTNEFLKVSPTTNIIGVTGTKGKGTTSTLIAKILEASGEKVHLGGNIGTPPLTLLKNNIQPQDFVVLELANFQLIDLHYSPHIAVCLMIVPEHLNWHSDMDEYLLAKQQLFAHQTSDDIAIYFADNDHSQGVAFVSKGRKIPYFAEPGAIVHDQQIIIDNRQVCQVSELKLLGQHNWQNVCAAITVTWQVTQDIPAIRSIITSFTGLEHRLEFVREVSGVKYYDDSFGTTPETAIVAVEAFKQPEVLILGGSDKGAEYDELAKVVLDNKVRHVVLIGNTGLKIGAALKTAGFESISEGGLNMPEIVREAHKRAQTGDVVLLSTACASFGLFQNYKDRGEQFKQAVQALA